MMKRKRLPEVEATRVILELVRGCCSTPSNRAPRGDQGVTHPHGQPAAEITSRRRAVQHQEPAGVATEVAVEGANRRGGLSAQRDETKVDGQRGVLVADQLGILRTDPPDDVVIRRIAVRVFDRQLGLAHTAQPAQCEDDAYLDPQVGGLLPRIEAGPHPRLLPDSDARFGAEVSVTTTDGRHLHKIVDAAAARESVAINPKMIEIVNSSRSGWTQAGGELISLPPEDQAAMMKTLGSVGADVTNAKPMLHDAYKVVTEAAARTR